MTESGSRRPLRSRDWPAIRGAARMLARAGIAPNHISLASIVFAASAGGCLLAVPGTAGMERAALCWGAGLLILCRALCNLFDGLVAVEGGRGTCSGELFNDIPDRIADPLILVAAGYATTICAWMPAIGWCAGLLAVMTAYVRTLARGLGAPVDFGGPMAKPHRMAVMMAACAAAPFETAFLPAGSLFAAALALVVTGCVLTLWLRIRRAHAALEGAGHG